MKTKIKFSLLIFFINFLVFVFVSCSGSVSQDFRGSVTIDTEKLVQYVTERSPFFSNSNHTVRVMADTTPSSTLTYRLIVRLSTQGDYSTNQEAIYTQTISSEQNNTNNTIIEEMFRNNMNKTLTISDIPVGSNISVKADVSMRISSDLNIQLNEYQIATGSSNIFTVQEGSNPVTIRLRVFDNDNEEEEEEGEGEEGEVPVNIILYNNVPGRTDNALYSFDMKIAGNSLTADNRQELIALDEYTLLDYESDAAGTLYYLVRDAAYDDYVKIIKPDNTSSSERVASPSGNMSSTKLAIDANSGNFFYGGLSENYFYIDTLPGCGQSNGNSFEMSAIDNDYSSLLDFTVSLGEPSVVTNEGTTTTTYSNAVAYIAMLWNQYDMYDPSHLPNNYDIFFIENPFTYTITDDGTNVTTAFNMSSPTSPVIYLSQTSFNFPYNNYFGSSYSVTDMIIHNGYLYSLLSLTDGAGPYDEGSGDGGFPYSLYSYGALVKINLDDFSISGVTIYGYDDSNCTDFNGIEATDSKTINFEAYQPASVNAPYFFGPRKFVAIKPKELVISDDGYFYYMDGSDFCYKNVDRLVVYNEDNNELQAYLLDTAGVIKFDNHADSDVDLEVLGTGGMSRNPAISATCKYRQ